MNPWIVAVLTASGLTVVFLIVATVASISTVKDLGRAARRFSDEVGGLASEINGEAARAGDRVARLEPPRRTRAS